MVVNSSSYVPPTGFMNSKHLPAPMKWGKAVALICPLMWLRSYLFRQVHLLVGLAWGQVTFQEVYLPQ